jgi:hypothetical protein
MIAVTEIKELHKQANELLMLSRAADSMKWMLKHFVWEQFQNGQPDYSPELKEAFRVFDGLNQLTGKSVRFCPFCSCPLELGHSSCPVCNEDLTEK